MEGQVGEAPVELGGVGSVTMKQTCWQQHWMCHLFTQYVAVPIWGVCHCWHTGSCIWICSCKSLFVHLCVRTKKDITFVTHTLTDLINKWKWSQRNFAITLLYGISKFKQHKGAPEIAMLASCSKRTVYSILALYHKYGQVNNPHACPCGCPHILDIGVLNYISSLLDANPTLYLDEIQEKLLEIHNIEVHISTISSL